MSLFSVPPCVTRLVPLAVLVAGLSVPMMSFAGQKTVQKETRRQAASSPEMVNAEAVSLETEGDTALAEGKYSEAAGRYHAALERVPEASKQRRNLVTKFASVSLKYADEQAKNGQIDQAVLTLNAVLDDRVAPKYKPALALKEQIQDADRYNPAQSPAHVEATKKVRDLFTMAEGYMANGDFKAAKGCYNQILAVDTTNTAARRGLERVEKLTSNYLRAARDHTHIRMLNDVDRLWEMPVIAPQPLSRVPGGDGSPIAAGYSVAAAKMNSIVLDRVAMADTPLREALTYLVRKSRDLDTAEPNPDARGVNIIFNPGSKPESGFPAVTLDLKTTTLGEALKAIAALTQTRIGTQGNTITVTPLGEGSRIVVRRFRVAPGFLTKSGAADVSADAGGNDPFAGGDDKGTGSILKISRVSAQDWLLRNGVPFPEGTGADYIPADNVLIVRNTEENLALVDTVIESTTDKTQRQVLITVTMLKTEQRNLEELGYDWLLGQTNVGSGGVFVSGGTTGNAAANGAGLAENYNLVAPNGVANGAFPVTSGLRGASGLKSNPGIDDVLTSGIASGGGRSPGILGIGGVFTDPQVSMMMRGLNQKKGIDISTAQKLVLKAGQRATASSTRQIPYPTEFDPPQIPQTITTPRLEFTDGTYIDLASNSTPPVTPTTPQSFEFKDTGSTLEVEATVGADGSTVDLSVSAVFSEFDGFINYGTPITTGTVVLTDNKIFQPVFSKVAVNTPGLSITDGSTITIGGLSQGKWSTIEDKVPLLGDIPFIGRFFRSDVKEVSHKAVVYFIKVNVVDPGGVGVREAAVIAEKAEAESASEGR
ncbi:MAG: hypothetical protein V4726_24730 [Verrucomicrobiota bacterium]